MLQAARTGGQQIGVADVAGADFGGDEKVATLVVAQGTPQQLFRVATGIVFRRIKVAVADGNRVVNGRQIGVIAAIVRRGAATKVPKAQANGVDCPAAG